MRPVNSGKKIIFIDFGCESRSILFHQADSALIHTIGDHQVTDDTDDLFGKPPLMKGEDKERYFRLLAAVKHQIEPKTFFDELWVRELTDKIWEQHRCKDSVAALVEGAFVEALASLLLPFIAPPMVSIGEDAATEMARNYYSGIANPKKMKEIELLLAQYGITQEQIRAKAMQLCGGGVLMFNRMGTNCENSLRALRKDNERRLALQKPEACESVKLEEVD
jgi:hypothetical protein